jgi:hypothetical protein
MTPRIHTVTIGNESTVAIASAIKAFFLGMLVQTTLMNTCISFACGPIPAIHLQSRQRQIPQFWSRAPIVCTARVSVLATAIDSVSFCNFLAHQ